MEAIELHNVEEWTAFEVKPSKCVISADERGLAEHLRKEGYCMIDRTIKAVIPLKKDRDFSRLCRIPLEQAKEPGARIYEIAKQAFLPDSRFFDRANPSQEEIKTSIEAYVEQMGAFYICRCKGEIAGFLELVTEGSEACIRLAAVDEAYRVAGAALSLYAGAAAACREQGVKKLWGRISSHNMPVMNLYASLGAAFSLPLDVYVKG